MNMEKRNYARHVESKQYVFFADGCLPPAIVKEHPEQWVLFKKPLEHTVIPFRLIGESTTAYCERYGHVPRVCSWCKRS